MMAMLETGGGSANRQQQTKGRSAGAQVAACLSHPLDGQSVERDVA